VIEASSGAFGRWGLCVGDVVEVRHVGDQPDPHPPTHEHRASPTGNLHRAELVAAG